MKKTLTPDISRYDNKMLLKFDFRTIRALLIALIAAVIGYVAIAVLTTSIDALIGAVIVFVVAAILQIGEIGGVPLIRIIGLILMDTLGRRDIRAYDHTTNDLAERLVIERRAGNAKRKENTDQKAK